MHHEKQGHLTERTQEQFPVVRTDHGMVAGEMRDGIAVFRGIPYGDRCDRTRRFQPAGEAEDWDGVKDCTKNGPICVQMAGSVSDEYATGGHPEKLGLRYETQDENCLCLNVLTPGTDRKRRPVMVYLHGGGYGILSGTNMLGADRLAREQDLVLVSVNHRLHLFGYLYLGDLDSRFPDSGNVGHLDLILALKWVRKNIESFGGDPDCVTIIGESGGADKVSTLLHMPEARGLFHRAIAISGSLPVGKLTREKATEHTLEVLRCLRVSPDHPDKLFELPARYMTQTIMSAETGMWDMTFMPVADGIHLPQSPGNGFGPGIHTPEVPLLLGASEDEVSSFSDRASMGVTEENLREKLLEYGPRFAVRLNEENIDRLLQVFRAGNHRRDNAQQLFLKILSVASYLQSGAVFQAECYAREGRNPVFLYLNRYDMPMEELGGCLCSAHCMDLPMIFRMVARPEMEEYSRTYAAVCAAFMRTGDPSVPGLPWKPFDPDERLVMVCDHVFGMERDPLEAERHAIADIHGEMAVINTFRLHNKRLSFE